ncbi:MAG TPA: hypothetical protein VG869_08975 [Acidimicrobiia bacterium]|jgi:hypothetical protein|nr:hypothetical protein [Acidimicrobiia bacterium]
MTSGATLRTWIEALALRVAPGASETDLSVRPPHADEPVLVVRRQDPQTWDVVHERRVTASVLSSDWQAPWDSEPAAAVVGRAARQVAFGSPLVESGTRDDGGDLMVRFRAPVFDDGLTRQAFVLTVSSVLKAAQAFELVMEHRADELVAWKEFQATSEQRRKDQQDLIKQMTGPPRMPRSP